LVECVFLVALGLTTAVGVPIVGALLVFVLLVGPAAVAESLTGSPPAALGLSILLALAIVWSSLALSFQTGWPVGFFVGVTAAGLFLAVQLGRRTGIGIVAGLR